MTTESYTTVIVTPSEGRKLTNKADVDIKDRVIASRIALGYNDSVDNYVEITLEEAEAYETAKAKAAEEVASALQAEAEPETENVNTPV